MDRYFCAIRKNLQAADTGHVFRRNAVRLWVCASRDGAVLLSGRSKGLFDTSFFQDLERRFRACEVGSKTCQFSQAYVIAHEIGHHVQNLLDLLPKVQQAKRAMDKAEANSLQVRVELQADCLAGVWANRGQAKWEFIEPGDVDSALQTASAIGDDRLQRQTQGYVVPDAFTHGTSAQRSRWFMTGLKAGNVGSCDTFRAEQL